MITTPAVLSAFTTAIAAPSVDSLSERFAATSFYVGFRLLSKSPASTKAFCSPSFLHQWLFLIYLRLQQLLLPCVVFILSKIPILN
jgi:hypothetical protein